MADELSVLLPEGISAKLCPMPDPERKGSWCVQLICGDEVIAYWDCMADEATARWVAGILKTDIEGRQT
jgi:hypothetical protein